MWFSKVLNAERLKKIKANRETFSFKADKLIIYNFFSTASLSVYSELLIAFQNQFALSQAVSGGVSNLMGDVKRCNLLSGTYDQKFYFNAQKCELSKVQILLACLTCMQNKY